MAQDIRQTAKNAAVFVGSTVFIPVLLAALRVPWPIIAGFSGMVLLALLAIGHAPMPSGALWRKAMLPIIAMGLCFVGFGASAIWYWFSLRPAPQGALTQDVRAQRELPEAALEARSSTVEAPQPPTTQDKAAPETKASLPSTRVGYTKPLGEFNSEFVALMSTPILKVEDLPGFYARMNDWATRTGGWIDRNMGPAASARFDDMSGQTKMIWPKALNEEHNDFITAAMRRKENLRALLETSAYDPDPAPTSRNQSPGTVLQEKR